jgi:hypothetical protein
MTSFNPDTQTLSQPLLLLGKKQEELVTEPDEKQFKPEPLFFEYLKPTISSLQRNRSQIQSNTRNNRRKQSTLSQFQTA